MPIIGIDLGTTNSLVSCIKDGKSILIPNALGQYVTPSAVSILDNDEIVAGAAAKERMLTHPDRTAISFKRYMGTDKKYSMGKYTFTPVELSTFILKSLKADAEAFLNEEIQEAVISVPAYFNDKQRRETKEAGKMAGLHVERLINEPTAAAMAYGCHLMEGESKFLIFDLGGGTFDVSVLDFFEDIMEVKAVAGNNHLGGDDFDFLLVSKFIEAFTLDQYKLTLKEMSALKKEAERCKIAFSSEKQVEMNCTIGGKDHVLPIAENEFEQMSKNLVMKIRQPVQLALKDAGISSHDLDNIILVGGSTKMPLIRSFVLKLFGRFPMIELNPDEVVAIGAGVCAGLKEKNQIVKEMVLTDVCPYTLGCEVVSKNQFGEYDSGHFLPIIERNTVIPYSKVERLDTVGDNQTQIKITIYQGESRLVANNIKLGEVAIAVPPKPKGKASVMVRYTYDLNGILEVEVESMDTGEKKRKVIINEENGLTEKQIEARLESLKHIKIHPREKSKNSFLLAKAERLYEESRSDFRQYIGQKIQYFEAVLDRQNPAEIEAAALEFEKLLNSIEE